MSALASSDALGSSVSASSEPTAKDKVLDACEVSLSVMKELNEQMNEWKTLDKADMHFYNQNLASNLTT